LFALHLPTLLRIESLEKQISNCSSFVLWGLAKVSKKTLMTLEAKVKALDAKPASYIL